MAWVRLCTVLWAAGWLVACAEGPTTVLVQIEGDSSIASVDVEVSLEDGARTVRTLPLGNGKSLPGRVVVELADIATLVTVRASAQVAGTTYVDQDAVQSVPHRQVGMTLVVGPQPPDLGASSADLAVRADDDLAGLTPLDFSVGPAPDLSGVPALEIVIGDYGGPGYHNDVGADARLEEVAGIAVVGTKAYVTQLWVGRLRIIDLVTHETSTPMITSAVTGNYYSFNGANSLAYDGNGHLYVAETEAHLISRLDLATGTVTRIIGADGSSGTTDGDASVARFNRPSYLTYDPSGGPNGVLWIADVIGDRIRRLSLDGTPTVSTPAITNGVDMGTPTTFTELRGLQVSGGSLYALDAGGVTKIDLATYSAQQWVPKNKLQDAEQLAVTTDAIFVVDSAYNSIWRFPLANPAAGMVIAGANTYGFSSVDGIGAAARFQEPRQIAAWGDTTLLVTEPYSIRAISTVDNAVTTVAGRAVHRGSSNNPPTRLSSPNQLFYDGTDALYIADYEGNRIRKWTVSTNTLSTFAGTGDYAHADGPAQSASFNGPRGIARDTAGNVYIADANNNVVRRIDAAGEVTTIVGHVGMGSAAPATDGLNGADVYLGYPGALVFDGAQTLFLNDSGNGVVLAISLADNTYKTSVLAGNPTMKGSQNGVGRAARFDNPRGLAYDAAQKLLYVADPNVQTVRKIDVTNPAMASVTTLSGIAYSPFGDGVPAGDGGPLNATRHDGPSGLALAKNGTVLFVANAGGHTVQRLDLAGNQSTTVVGVPNEAFVKPGALPARLHDPVGVAVIDGLLYISSGDENCVLRASGVVP